MIKAFFTSFLLSFDFYVGCFLNVQCMYLNKICVIIHVSIHGTFVRASKVYWVWIISVSQVCTVCILISHVKYQNYKQVCVLIILQSEVLVSSNRDRALELALPVGDHHLHQTHACLLANHNDKEITHVCDKSILYGVEIFVLKSNNWFSVSYVCILLPHCM